MDDYRIDTRLVRKAASRSADSYARQAHVFDEIANRLLERLELLSMSPARILDLGTGDGRHLDTLKKMYPNAIVIGADICETALRSRKKRFWQKHPHRVCMDANRHWPFVNDSFDLVVSNMVLPWINETDLLAAELKRVLASGGAFFFSSAGPDTLVELRQAWQQVDSSVHVNAFLDMHDVGDMFARAGLADPVMDAERIEVRYADVDSLLTELVATGCTCVADGRRRALMSKRVRDRLALAYDSSDPDTVTATLELVVAHGWWQSPNSDQLAGAEQASEKIVHFHRKPWRTNVR